MTKTESVREQFPALFDRLVEQVNDRLLAGYFGYLREIVEARNTPYRVRYCEHGTDQWTDYDNICGPCEDGLTMREPAQRQEFAEDEAERRISAFVEGTRALATLRRLYMIDDSQAESQIARKICDVLDVGKVV